MSFAIQADTVESALREFFRLSEFPDDSDIRPSNLVLGDWVRIQIKLPTGEINSIITPPYMEAFLEIQKQLFQLAAFLKTGVANTRELTETEKQELSIIVRVTEGSSYLDSPLAKKIEKAISMMVGKMDGKQAVIVFLGVSLIAGSAWGVTSYLENEKEVRLAEIKSAEHREVLQNLSFANKAQVEVFTKVLDVLENIGENGRRAARAALAANDALVRAASKTTQSEIQGQPLSAGAAESLRATTRKETKPRIVTVDMRVVRWDTTNDDETGIVLRNPLTDEDFRITIPDSLFAAETRSKLHAAVNSREFVRVEALVKEADGEVKSFDFLRIIDKSAN
jgi:hypothetical protein